MATIRRVKIADLVPDGRNANLGTERGLRAPEDSIRQDGAADAGTIDRNGVIISGNKRAERFADLGLDEVLVVETDGSTPVYVQRTDVDANTPEGRRLAVALNRVHELDLAWDAAELQALVDDGIDLGALWSDEEFAALTGGEPVAFGGDDRAGASPWERMQGDAADGVMFSFGSIQARLPQELYEAFELSCPADGLPCFIEECLRRGLVDCGS